MDVLSRKIRQDSHLLVSANSSRNSYTSTRFQNVIDLHVGIEAWLLIPWSLGMYRKNTSTATLVCTKFEGYKCSYFRPLSNGTWHCCYGYQKMVLESWNILFIFYERDFHEISKTNYSLLDGFSFFTYILYSINLPIARSTNIIKNGWFANNNNYLLYSAS